MMNSIKQIVGRLKWATIQRKERNSREEAYRELAKCYEKAMHHMWERVRNSTEKEPNSFFYFNKKNATATFYFEREADKKRSHTLRMGNPNDEKKGAQLKDLDRNVEIPYFITSEIIVATAIASILSDKDCVTEEESSKILHDYYAAEPYKPLSLSKVWMSRLNSTMCYIWKMAPIMKRAMQIREERGLDLVIAQKIAIEEVKIAEPPSCLNSDNEDGRVNMSYPGSFFYTIDHHGIAICKEFPNEYLDLSDYETMKVVAATIYRDLTSNKDLEDLGISGALYLMEEEPDWKDENLFPWQSFPTPLAPLWFEVVADGYSHHYETLEEAESEKDIFESRGIEVDEKIYRDSCLPIGRYFVGDPSLVLIDWEKEKGIKYPLENGVYALNGQTYFAIYKAANGPGSYPDEEGNIHSTKSGYFAFLPIEDDESDLKSFIDIEICYALAEDGESYIYQFKDPVDTQIDRQCLGAIDFGPYPYIFTGDECWLEEDG